MYDLIKYGNNYAKKDKGVYGSTTSDNITDSESIIFVARITRRTHADGNRKDVEIAVPLKYLSNFWRTFEISLINCEINLILTWSANCIIIDSTVLEHSK